MRSLIGILARLQAPEASIVMPTKYFLGLIGQAMGNLAQVVSIPGSADAPVTYFANGYASADQPPIPSGTAQLSSPTRTIGSTITTGSHLAGYLIQAVGMYCADVTGDGPEWQAAFYEVASAGSGTLAFQTTAEIAAVEAFWNENPNFSNAILKPLTTYVIAVQNKGTGNTVKHSSGSANAFGFFTSTYGSFPDPSTWTANGQYSLYVRTVAA